MDIKKDLAMALKIELATIPLYLYAMHSIRIDDTEEGKNGAATRARIAVIVQQEMLHLALAGNVFTSLDSDGHLGPKLYSEEYLVHYGRDDILFFEIPLKLEPCHKKSLELFMKLESPYIEPPDDGEAEHIPKASLWDNELHDGIARDSRSIGEFYAKLKSDVTRTTHWGNRDYQFSPAEFFGSNMVQVTDMESALKALDIITEQGEGYGSDEKAHYQMFIELWNHVDWKCWPVPSSPTTEDYRNSPFVYQLALAHNATFCYLLITIQRTWTVSGTSDRHALNRNNHAIMLNVLGPLGDFMAKQPFNGGTAGPPFEFYTVPGGQKLDQVDQAARALHKAIGAHLDKAIAVANPFQSAELKPMRLSVDRIEWPIKQGQVHRGHTTCMDHF
ncbi:hypothetical protein OG21DRAFT_1483577 [Imleria badia]|nr:hypothetical protein OG21DRAFT_1483577 [Imleria badia]